MSDVLLGAGLATGMFYHAPEGTTFPTYPTETLAAAWELVGDVSIDGVTLALNKSAENVKNWAGEIVRIILTEHDETVQAPIIDTTQEVLETVLGASNVSTTAASNAHGALVTADLSGGLPDPECYLFVMKDGDNTLAIYCTGQIQAMENITFAPGEPIKWTPTITALEDSMTIIKDDGQTI